MQVLQICEPSRVSAGIHCREHPPVHLLPGSCHGLLSEEDSSAGWRHGPFLWVRVCSQTSCLSIECSHVHTYNAGSSNLDGVMNLFCGQWLSQLLICYTAALLWLLDLMFLVFSPALWHTFQNAHLYTVVVSRSTYTVIMLNIHCYYAYCIWLLLPVHDVTTGHIVFCDISLAASSNLAFRVQGLYD